MNIRIDVREGKLFVYPFNKDELALFKIRENGYYGGQGEIYLKKQEIKDLIKILEDVIK